MKNKNILEGYNRYFEKAIDPNDDDRDPNVFESYKKDGIWYLYRSFEAFDDEMNERKRYCNPIPRNELVKEHWKKYPNIA